MAEVEFRVLARACPRGRNKMAATLDRRFTANDARISPAESTPATLDLTQR